MGMTKYAYDILAGICTFTENLHIGNLHTENLRTGNLYIRNLHQEIYGIYI
jgi:hypothetical protein